MKNIVFFDLETTGNDKNTSMIRIIEISAIKVDENLETIDSIYFKCNNDGIPISDGAFEKHGISEFDIFDLPTFTEVAKKVYEFFDGCDVGGYYCTKFDVPILYDSFLRAGLTWNFRELKIYDCYTIYKKFNSGKLSDVYKKYTGKDLDNAHNADADTKATIELFKKQKEQGENLDEEELSTYSNNLDVMGYFMVGYTPEGKRYIYLTFGKYKDKDIEEIDPSYLEWIANNEEGFPTDTRHYARKLISKIKR